MIYLIWGVPLKKKKCDFLTILCYNNGRLFFFLYEYQRNKLAGDSTTINQRICVNLLEEQKNILWMTTKLYALNMWPFWDKQQTSLEARDNILLCKIYQELQSSTGRPKLGKYCMYRLSQQLLFKIAFFRNFSVKSLFFVSLIKFPLKLESNVSNL